MDTCTMQEFKQMAKELLLALPTLNQEELDNAQKCFNIGYLTVKYENPADEFMAVALVKHVNIKCLDREFELSGLGI